MNIIALVKYIPNPEGPPQMGPDHRLVREGVEGALDPGDEHVVEAALQLAEQSGGEVTALSMGPEPALAGADTLATARVLAAAVRRGEFDLVIGGGESTDGYTGTLPRAVAEFLGIPNATFARHIELKDGSIRIERQTEMGYDVVECALPAVVTVTAGANEPRYPT